MKSHVFVWSAEQKHVGCEKGRKYRSGQEPAAGMSPLLIKTAAEFLCTFSK